MNMKSSLLPILALAGFASANPAATTTKPQECQSVILIAPKFTHGPVRTVWTTTATTTSIVDCTPCAGGVKPIYLPLGPGPVIFFDTTTTVAEPSLATDYKCVPGGAKPTLATTAGGNQNATPKITSKPSVKSPAPTFATKTTTVRSDKDKDEEQQGYPPELGPKTVSPPGVEHPVCTISTYVDPYIPDATSTVFRSTVKSTKTVNCRSCALVWSTAVINYVAPHIYTSTVTARKPSTKVELACSPTKTSIRF